MSQIQDFSPEQIEEATNWFKENAPRVLDVDIDYVDLADVYFKLKMISIELRPNQFVIGVDYTGVSQADYLKHGDNTDFSKVKINLNFWNPHPKGVADKLAKDILVAQLAKL